MAPARTTESDSSSQLTGKLFGNEEIGAELRLALCDKPLEQVSSIGQYTIKWKRYDYMQIYFITKKISLFFQKNLFLH